MDGKSNIVGVAAHTAATTIKDSGFDRGGIDNRLCREEVITEAFATVREYDKVERADFYKMVMREVR